MDIMLVEIELAFLYREKKIHVNIELLLRAHGLVLDDCRGILKVAMYTFGSRMSLWRFGVPRAKTIIAMAVIVYIQGSGLGV